MSDYWVETMAEILSEHGVTVSEAQISAIAKDVDGASSVRGELTMPIISGDTPEVKIVEVYFSTCPDCRGSGFTPCGPSHSATCLKCGGTGKIKD